MRAVSKADYDKGGNIPSYEVLKVVTDGGEFNPDEMYFHDYDEDTEYLCWEERRYEIAKDILATSHIAQQIGKYGYHCEEEVKEAVRMADLLIAELKKTNETK